MGSAISLCFSLAFSDVVARHPVRYMFLAFVVLVIVDFINNNFP